MSIDTIADIKAFVQIAENEFSRFKGGNKAAGTRARKALMDVKKLADQMRKDIQAMKKLAVAG